MSDPKPTPKERGATFVGALRGVREDRGKLAALRRGLSDNPKMRVDAWPIIAGLGGDISSVFVAVAALFAAHPKESDNRNFGETCRRAAPADGKKIAESAERRFRRLLACGETVDLIEQVRCWVRLASSKEVGVDYEALFADLWNWPWYADQIRVKWARAFWQSAETTAISQLADETIA